MRVVSMAAGAAAVTLPKSLRADVPAAKTAATRAVSRPPKLPPEAVGYGGSGAAPNIGSLADKSTTKRYPGYCQVKDATIGFGHAAAWNRVASGGDCLAPDPKSASPKHPVVPRIVVDACSG